MKKLYVTLVPKTVLFLFLLNLLSFSSKANPGDTTWVTIYNLRKITQYGTYDTVTSFPTGLRYRKIRMHYILGRYACPAGSQYCGSWDYTTQIYARPAGLDSVEIARIITPYAGAWSLSQTHDYIVDVTDYASVLQGATAMRFNYEGYSWGFTITLKLEMIEGTPPHDALSVKNIYDGYFPYGDSSAANTIEKYLVPKPMSYTVTGSQPMIRNTVTGHGYDASSTQCAEFCSKYYKLNINSSLISQTQLWRTDCGANEVSPQAGTWIYSRANWCPGAVVNPIYHDLSTLVNPNTTFTVDADMQPYVAPLSGQSALGGFNWVSHLIDYSAPNYSLDVAIEDIVAPTNNGDYKRENPTCMGPVIRIKNTGSQPVTSVVLNYGLAGGATNSYTWTGSLNFLDQTDVVIASPAPGFTNTVATTFTVALASVNGMQDDNTFNNAFQSTAPPAPVYPSSFVIKMMTNNFNLSNETSWYLYDNANNILYSESYLASNTLYTDTVSLADGCYHFSVVDQLCDGLNNLYYGAGNGSVYLSKSNGPGTLATFSNDFGCGFDVYFKVVTIKDTTSTGGNVGIQSFTRDNEVDVYPNPASQKAYIRFDLNKSQNVSYSITDVSGRQIQQKSLGAVSAFYEQVDLSSFSNGLYIVSIKLEDGSSVTKKLIVQQ